MKSSLRIPALLWADILVVYAFFVMQKYLTDVWESSFTHAAGILNIWGGISMILPVFFLFLVDQFLGNFKMLVISSISYSVGISFVTMSTPPVLANSTNTCKQYEPQCIGDTQRVLFYTGMALVAVGAAGHMASVQPFLEEQRDKFDDNAEKTNILELSVLLWVGLIPVIGAIALPYVKPWSLRFGIPAIFTTFTTLHFFSGSLDYHKADPQGSPLTNVCRVFVAFVSKKSEPVPLDSNQLYRKDYENVQSFSRTRVLRCLEKAAVILPDTKLEDQVQNRWRLCTVAEVEEAKIVVGMIPMWLTFIVCGIISSIGNTYFIEQANHMNRELGNWKVPLQILLLFYGWARKFTSSLADVFLRRSRNYARPVMGIAIAMIFSIVCCITASRVEKRRLHVIISHGLLDKPDEDIPMSVYWLVPQFFLLAGLDSFLEKSASAFYQDRAPESLRRYLHFLAKGVSGLGFMCSVLSVYVVGKVIEKNGKRSWFQFTSNGSHLDRYYWVLAALSSVNLVVFIMVALSYRYKNREAQYDDEDDEE